MPLPPPRPPPTAAARALLGCVLTSSRAAAEVVVSSVLHQAWPTPELRCLAACIAEDHAAGLDVGALALATRRPTIPGVDGLVGLLMALQSEACLPSALPTLCEQVSSWYRETYESDDAPEVIDCRPSSAAYARGDEVELGQHMAGALGRRGLAAYTEGRIIRYRGGVWHELDEAAARVLAHGYAGQPRAKRGPKGPTTEPIALSVRGLSGIVRTAEDVLHDPTWSSRRPAVAAFRGVVARLDGTRVVMEPTTRAHMVLASDVSDYAPGAPEAPVFIAALARAWAHADDVEERIQYLLEWVGAALLGIAHRWKDSPLLYGVKDSGKSRVLDAIAHLFPPGSRRNIPLHSLSGEYYRAGLAGARLNVVSELPAREILDGEAAKAILSGDPVTARHPHGRPFTLVPRCAHLFAANALPPTLDRALADRLVLLDCPTAVPVAEQDAMLAERLCAEAPGIARLALDAVPALLARGRFLRPASATASGREWVDGSDTVAAFAAERLRASTAQAVSGATVYDMYRQWCARHGHDRPLASNRFAARLAALPDGIYRTRTRLGSMWSCQVLTDADCMREAEAEAAERRWGLL